MTARRLIMAWGQLSVLTAFGTAMHFAALPGEVTGTLILAAATLKARLILLDYLEVRGVEGWSGGLQTALAALIVLFLVLYLAA